MINSLIVLKTSRTPFNYSSILLFQALSLIHHNTFFTVQYYKDMHGLITFWRSIDQSHAKCNINVNHRTLYTACNHFLTKVYFLLLLQSTPNSEMDSLQSAHKPHYTLRPFNAIENNLNGSFNNIIGNANNSQSVQ